MTGLTPNHPAILAADAAVCEKDGLDASYLVNIPHAINAALPHLTADDLRHTPAGRALMAEGWKEATVWVRYRDGTWPQDMEDANPYREETRDDHA